jgi:hypothetical protein
VTAVDVGKEAGISGKNRDGTFSLNRRVRCLCLQLIREQADTESEEADGAGAHNPRLACKISSNPAHTYPLVLWLYFH